MRRKIAKLNTILVLVSFLLVGCEQRPIDSEPIDSEPIDSEPIDSEPIDSEVEYTKLVSLHLKKHNIYYNESYRMMLIENERPSAFLTSVQISSNPKTKKINLNLKFWNSPIQRKYEIYLLGENKFYGAREYVAYDQNTGDQEPIEYGLNFVVDEAALRKENKILLSLDKKTDLILDQKDLGAFFDHVDKRNLEGKNSGVFYKSIEY